MAKWVSISWLSSISCAPPCGKCRTCRLLAIVVGDDVAGMVQHIVVTPKKAAVKVSFAQAYYIVSLAKNEMIPPFVRRVELAGLPTERDDGCQTNIEIDGFHRQQCFSRKHVKTCRHAAKEVADAPNGSNP